MNKNKDVINMDRDKVVFRMIKPEDSLEWFKLKNKVWRDAYKDIFPEEE